MLKSREYAARMIENLMAALNKRLQDRTIAYYLDHLERLSLPERTWSSATSAIVADSIDTAQFPSLPKLQKALLGQNYGAMIDSCWVTYQQDGKPYARKCPDPSNPPCPPDSATDLHLVLPDSKLYYDYHAVPFAEGIVVARDAYLEAGGLVGKWMQIERALRTALPPLRKTAVETAVLEQDDDDPFLPAA